MPVPPDPEAATRLDATLMADAPRWLHARGLLDILRGGGNDPRVGSTRSDSSGGGTFSSANNSKTSSLSKLGATFIPIVIFIAICLVIFVVLRRRLIRVYAPRTIPSLRAPEFPTPPLPGGWFNWVIPFFKIPDTFVLNQGSLDGFFFLRFLKVIRNICLGGCIILWPVLFPIHATGGGGLSQLDLLTIGNVRDPKKLYAHVFMAWLFFGFVLYMIVRECIFYVNIRQAYLSSPYYSQRISSRTILITGIPKQYLDEQRLRKLYGDSVKRVHIPRTTKPLANLVKEREQTATRLEKAEILLIQKANKAKQKQLKKPSSKPHQRPEPTSAADSVTSRQELVTISSCSANESVSRSAGNGSARRHDVSDSAPRGGHLVLDLPTPHLDLDEPGEKKVSGGADADAASNKDTKCATVKEEDLDYIHPYGLDDNLPDVRGSVAAQYLPVQSRPHHRPLGNFGRRVDTIRWTRNRLRELNMQIFKMRRQVRRGDGNTLPVAFLEFDTQESAQAAHQVVAHHRPLQMSSRILGIHPDEIIWPSLRMNWWELIIRRFFILSLITLAVIFWSIPSALIGLVSQIDFLAQNIFFLSWITRLPPVLVSFLQGFVPSIALSLWMAAIPGMLRICGAQSGLPSTAMVELFVQKCYFAFQVVQVFLVTTLTSAASAAFTQVLENPLKAKDVLATNLPMASNFYLSYILIQCLASCGANLTHIFAIIRHYAMPRLTSLPRVQYRNWHRLRPAKWGGMYPVYANMGVIALSYACIAPLVLIFAAGGMAAMRLVWRYNIIFIYDSTTDTKGLFYPHALLHLTIGLYLAEICMIGLFALHLAFGPLALMVIFFIFTGLVHFSLSDAIAPLLENLPQTLSMEDEIQQEERAAAERARERATARTDGGDGGAGAASSYYDPEQAFGDDDARGDDDYEESEDEAPVTNSRAVEGASGVKSALTEWIKSSTRSKVKAQALSVGLPDIFQKARFWAVDKHGAEPPGFLARWLHPEEYEDFVALRRMIPGDSLPVIQYPEDHKYRDYLPPEMWSSKPTLWIPRDEARVSRQEVAHTKKYTPISDRGVYLDKKGGMSVFMDQAPFERREMIL